MKIAPDTKLEIGTSVKVKTKIGIVKDVKYVQAIPSGMIYVHTIEFHSEIQSIRNSSGVRMDKIVPTKPSTKAVNYSFIEILN